VPGNYTHAVVAVEYFSKWVETKPLLSIACCFGVPYEVTVDNDKQFDSTDFKEFVLIWAPSYVLLRFTIHSPTGQ
jgi:hypothetical protein